MGVKDQLVKIKENWLLLVIAVLALFIFMSGGGMLNSFSKSMGQGMIYDISESAGYNKGGLGREYIPLPIGQDFAPDVTERKIVHTARVSTEVERGMFHESESKLKNIITSADAYMLNENVNKHGANRKSYYTGTYQIKVDTKKYESVVAQIKDIGEVRSFNEAQEDITGKYTKTEIEIEVEKERLRRYESMYDEAEQVSDKIVLSDKIFNLERRIKYMEDSLKTMGQRVDYSTIYITITEKRSEYAKIIFVKFSELVKSVVGSFNSLVRLIFVLIPWALALFAVWLIVKRIKR